MPLVVLLKSESEGPDKFTQLLEENDFDVRPVNCISFQFKNLDLLAEIISSADDYEGIIFTSQRSVQAVHEAVTKKSSLVNWRSKNNYAVGESTNELAQKLLNLETQGKETGNAEKLASLIIDNHAGNILKSFLFPSSNLKQGTLETALKENSIDVESVEVYDTVEHPNLEKSLEELKNMKVDFLVFFSPSGIKFSLPHLKQHAIDLSSMKIIAIGPSTEKSLEDNNLECFRMCTKPSPESLLEALKI